MKNTDKMLKSSLEAEDNANSYISLTITFICLLIIGWILSKIPNILDSKYILDNYNAFIEQFVPEQSEKAQYIVLTVLFPLLFISFYYIVNKINLSQKFKSSFNRIYQICSLLIIIILCYSMYFYSNIYSPQNILIMNPIIFLLTLPIVLSLVHSKQTKMLSWSVYCILIYVLVYLFLILSSDQTVKTFGSDHFSAYFAPILKTYDGLTPIVDFPSPYGGYPFILSFILFLTGGISSEKTIILLSFIQIIGYVLISYVLFKVTKNKIISLIGILSIIFLQYINTFLYSKDFYFQYLPNRFIFPAIIIFIAWRYISQYSNIKKRFTLTILGFIVSSISIFWNIDSGIVVAISWLALLIYTTLFYEKLLNKDTIKKIISFILFFLLSILASFLFTILIIFIRTDELNSISTILRSQLAFYGDGFYMLRMELIGPWIIVVCIYALGLMKSIRKLSFFSKNNGIKCFKKCSLYFLLSIMGMGLFSYYQGRSHLNCLWACCYPAIIMLTIFLSQDTKFLKYSDNNEIGTYCIKIRTSITFLFLTSFAISTLYSFICSPEYKTIVKNSCDESSNLYVISNYIKTKLDSNESNIDYLGMQNEPLVYEQLGMKYITPFPCQNDFYTKKDYDMFFDYIQTSSNKLFLDEHAFDYLNKFDAKRFEKYIVKRYSLIDISPQGVRYYQRLTSVTSNTYL